jgi:hypothetical protein
MRLSVLLEAVLFAASAAGLRLTSDVSGLRTANLHAQRTVTIFAQLGTPQLPPGWTAYTDEQTGQIYYCNEQTGQCQWDLPQQGYQQQQYGAQQYQQPQEQYALSGQEEETVAYIAQQLQEPQVRIPRAVVEFLGSAVALDLLEQAMQVQAAGGMIVTDTGKPRTNGGVYLQLLRGATNLPRDRLDAALERIRITGKHVKSWEKASTPGWS